MIKKHFLALLICTPIITYSMEGDDHNPATALMQYRDRQPASPAEARTRDNHSAGINTSQGGIYATGAAETTYEHVHTTLKHDGTSRDPELVAQVARKGGASVVGRGGCPVSLRGAFGLPRTAPDTAVTAQLVAFRTRYATDPVVLSGFDLLAKFHGLAPEQVGRHAV